MNTNHRRAAGPVRPAAAALLAARVAVAAVLAALAAGACGGGDTGPSAQRDPRILWEYQAPAGIYYASPALSSDEQTVYVGTSDAILGAAQAAHYLVAVRASDGTERWRYALGSSEVRSTPAVGPDGSVTFLAEERTSGSVSGEVVYRLSAEGTLAWTHRLGLAPNRVDVGFSAPAVAPDGSVYVASDSLYGLRPDGTRKWTYAVPTAPSYQEDLRASPVIGADGTVYFAAHNVPLTALHPDSGRVLWTLPLGFGDHVFASPAIGADGTLYVAVNACAVYAVSPGGTLLWTWDAAAAGRSCVARSSPAVTADGTVIFGVNGQSDASRSAVIALRSDGTLRWVFEPADLPADVPYTHFDIYSSPAVGSDGTVYFGQEFGRVYALDAAGGTQRWMVETGTGITWSSPALAADGTLFISDLNGMLYALRTESRGLQAGSPWPRYRHDDRSSGRTP